MKRLSYILLLIALNISVAYAENGNIEGEPVPQATSTSLTKIAGDEAYDRKQYGRAIEIYEAVIEEKGATAPLRYNLGNAYFRSNEIGKAILNYERALRLDPTDEDIKANLEFAQSRTKDEVMEQHDLFFIAWFHAIVNLLSVDVWATIAVVAFIAALAGLLLFLLVQRNGVRRTGLIMIIAGVVITLFANIAAYNMNSMLNDNTQAVVMKEEVTMMSAPGSSTALMKIHEGRKVTITDDSIEDWKEIELEDGTIGWVKKNDIERI